MGIGLVNPKLPRVESLEEVLPQARRALQILGKERLLLTPDCGFATFADNPVSSPSLAEGKLRTLAQCAEALSSR